MTASEQSATIVIAPDSFKGSATAAEAAAAIAEGWRSRRPQDRLLELPMADGGEGLLDAFERAVPGARRHRASVTEPVGSGRRSAAFLLLPDGTAVLEQAACGGLPDLAAPAPEAASSRGLGEAIAAALSIGATSLLIGLGGSASSDGGAGLLQALGAELLDDAGDSIGPGNAGLEAIAAARIAGLAPRPPGGVRVAVDVRNPLLGPQGAIAVFGPQKGVTPLLAPVMEARLARLAALLGIDPAVPGAGAGGGAAAGLLAWDAELVPGARTVAELLGVPAALNGAAAVVTGEGRYDGQTAGGKAPAVVAELAAAAGVSLLLVAGSIEAEPIGAFTAISLTELADGQAAHAIADPLPLLRRAGQHGAAALSQRLG